MNPRDRELIRSIREWVLKKISDPHSFGVVVSVSPLVVHLDGDFDDETETEITVEAESLLPAEPAIGSKVLCLKKDNQIYVIAGGN